MGVPVGTEIDISDQRAIRQRDNAARAQANVESPGKGRFLISLVLAAIIVACLAYLFLPGA